MARQAENGGFVWLTSSQPSSRVVSSAGRASPLQGEGRRFDPCTTHHFKAECQNVFWQPVQLTRLNRCGAVVQLVRIPACHAGGRGFESRPLRQLFPGWLAQLGEHRPYKARVAGSIPAPPTSFEEKQILQDLLFFRLQESLTGYADIKNRELDAPGFSSLRLCQARCYLPISDWPHTRTMLPLTPADAGLQYQAMASATSIGCPP